MEGIEERVWEVWLETVLEVIILVSSLQPHHHFEFFFFSFCFDLCPSQNLDKDMKNFYRYVLSIFGLR